MINNACRLLIRAVACKDRAAGGKPFAGKGDPKSATAILTVWWSHAVTLRKRNVRDFPLSNAIRACSLLAMLTGVLFTPVLGLLWLFSQWSEAGARAASWLGWPIAGNFILFFLGLYTFWEYKDPGTQ